ncbi:MAG: hypothetical protein J2P41_13350, partial [Blastocatellia bacterium]|nr:hypothetical protein [Blastocatellia bacterium]
MSKNTSKQTDTSEFPNTKRIYVEEGRLRVPFREISQHVTRSYNGAVEVNEPVRVYDTSGPWGDP